MDADHLQRSNILFLNFLVCRHILYRVHQTVSNELLIAFVYKDVVESLGSYLLRLLFVFKLPMNLDELTKLNGCRMI